MTRPIRLFGTLVAALVVSAAVSAGIGRAASRPEAALPAPAVATAPAATSAAPVTAAEQAALAPELLARATTSAKAGHRPSSDYALDRIPVASRVIMKLKDDYLDPTRFKPKEMLVASLKYVERKVAEVMVQGDAQSQKLTLTVGAASRDLDISGVNSIWEIRTKLGEAMAFVQDHLVAQQDPREIEYAAVNGMLSTLDPHTVLLDPKAAKEMTVRIRGEFGGVGFVIGMRNNNLTVIRVLKDTPAQKAGIKAKDVIARIDEQSTVNMDLQDAVDRLRGTPKTKVAVTVQRPGTEPKKLHITREMINIETVTESLLPGDVGYVRLSEFSGHTARDLRAAIRSLTVQREKGARLNGIVLDLRNNPGGLLDQAIQVSDLFLSEGEIVKQVGQGGAVQDVKQAHADPVNDVVNVPLVLLVNESSASASEIVAGALKNNNRALVIGRQTFGKGSVQQLVDVADPDPDLPDLPKLKFTIAQYLTPGDLSIQETGVTPDLLLVPGRALKEQVNVFAPPRSMREMDLEHHLVNAGAEKAAPPGADPGHKPAAAPERPSLELHYLLDEKDDLVAQKLRKEEAAAQGVAPTTDLTPEEQEEEETDADPDSFVKDYRIQFAAELLRRAPTALDRPHLLEAARALVAERSADEASRLEKRMKELGVDWSAAVPASGAPRAVVTLSPAPNREQRAGETMNWTVTVENRGDAPYRRLRAWTSCDKNGLFDRREFVFGTVPPGEKRSWTVQVKLPRGIDTRRDEVQFHFEDEAGKAPADLTTTVAVLEVPRPMFAFNVQVDDRQEGNGDGLPQRGEAFNIRVDVRNSGTGPAGDKTFVLLKNEGDEKLFITKGREVLGAMKPGEVKSATMQMELRRGPGGDTLPLRIRVRDEKNEQEVTDELQLPVARDAPPATAERGTVRVRAAQTALRTGASATADVLGMVRQGATFPVEARAGDFYRVTWGTGRVGFLAAADVTSGGAKHKLGAVSEVWQHDPPRIVFTPDPAKGAPVVDAESIRVSGSASLPSTAAPGARLRDLFIYVNEQKVFFKVQADDAAASRLDFSTDVPLVPGNNTILIFAREDEDLQSVRSIVVYRKPVPAVATDANRGPKTEERTQAQP
jgi:carboxyl-terminal processing protease